jgi:hypothetical protein
MISLDIESLVKDLELTKSELDQVRKLVVKAYVDEVYIRTVQLANNELFVTRSEYVNSLSVKKENEYSYSLVLSGSSLALMIENGASPFDMKVGFMKSGKVVNTKSGGWYLTIPMLFKTTNASTSSTIAGQIMPRSIYDLIRNNPTTKTQNGNIATSILAGKDVPAKYQPEALKALNRTADSYIPKSSIYAGLIRKQDLTTGKSSYNTFRRVSNNSDPKAWMHPGFEAKGLMDRATNSVDSLNIAETALQNFFPTTTIKIGIHGKLALDMNKKYNDMLSDMTSSIKEQIKSILK